MVKSLPEKVSVKLSFPWNYIATLGRDRILQTLLDNKDPLTLIGIHVKETKERTVEVKFDKE